jgi:hypothetical protein
MSGIPDEAGVSESIPLDGYGPFAHLNHVSDRPKAVQFS